MRLLLSAYACAPHMGSEHSVGWNWASEACRQGHEVWVITQSVYRDEIEKACALEPALGAIAWVFQDVPFWPSRPGTEPRWERTYDFLWQWAARRTARRLIARHRFDVVHHVTWGGLRAPTFLGKLGIPLIIGPVGGGETSPKTLRPALTPRARATEFIRDLSNATIALNPLTRWGFRDAALIFARTPETKEALPPAWQEKCLTFIDPTISGHTRLTTQGARPGFPNLLCAGRLLYWKGMHIGVLAFADLAKRFPQAHLTILGSGPEEARLKAQVDELGLAGKVSFIAWVSRARMPEIFGLHDMLLFPSLHDSGGTVVLEALDHGLPVACLDVGGPCQMVTRQSGLVLATADLTTESLARNLATALCDLFAEDGKLAELRAGARNRAQDFRLPLRVGEFYAKVENHMQNRSGSPAMHLARTGGLARSPI